MTEAEGPGPETRLANPAPSPPSLAAPPSARVVFGDRLAQAVEYVGLLADTGIAHGLIGPREAPRLWDRHVLNCAVIAQMIPPAARVADIGSGAGLPGIALAIARPDLTVTLIEPMARRASWLRRAIAELGLAGVTVLEGRAENAARHEVDVVTARAVASIDKLAAWGLPLLGPGGLILALKGSSAAHELSQHEKTLFRLGARGATVEVCGRGVVDPPTTIIKVVASPRGRPEPTGKSRDRQGRAPLRLGNGPPRR